MTRLNGLAAAALLAVVFGTYSGAAIAQELYGSVAFSTEPGGGYAWGISWNYNHREAARNRAVTVCQDRGGSGCEEQLSFNNGCGALFIGGTNGWGIGTGGSSLRAEAQAREACESVNENCRLAVSQCTSEPGNPAVIMAEAGSSRTLYGSIAFSQEITGGYAWGISWDHDSRESATGSAIAVCQGKGGTYCAERLGFRNGCGALVVGSPNAWVVAPSDSQGRAETAAREACQSSHADCQLAVSQCTSEPGTSPAVTALAGSYQPPVTAPARQEAVAEPAQQDAVAENRPRSDTPEPNPAQVEGGEDAASAGAEPPEQEEPVTPGPVQRGTLTYNDGSVYEGEHRDGQRHGRGTYTWADGNHYEGEWHEDKVHGQGIMTWHYGDRYEGEYRDGQRHGRGTYTWADGRRFEGEWQDDKAVR